MSRPPQPANANINIDVEKRFQHQQFAPVLGFAVVPAVLSGWVQFVSPVLKLCNRNAGEARTSDLLRLGFSYSI